MIFIISFLLHLAIVLAVGHYKNAMLWENGEIAQHIAAGDGFSAGLSIPDEPTSWQAPGYPYLLAATWATIGKNSTGHLFISVLQCLALSSMIWPMGGLSRRWFPAVPVWIVQWIAVIAPLYLWYATRLHHTAFVMAFQPWLLFAWLEWAGQDVRKSLAAGVITGVAAMFQPVLLGVLGIIGIVQLIAALLSKKIHRAMMLIFAGITVLICLVPWTVRNYQVHGRLVLVKDSFGKEFWMGNNAHATGTGYAIGGSAEITNAFPPEAMKLRGQVSEMQLMDALKEEAKEWIRSHPSEFVNLTARKILWFWTLPPKDRVRSTGDAEAILFRGVYLTYWIALLALVFFGCLVFQPPAEFYWTLALFVVFYSTIYGLTHVGQARFRGEIEYIFFPAAATGVFWILRRVFPQVVKAIGQ